MAVLKREVFKVTAAGKESVLYSKRESSNLRGESSQLYQEVCSTWNYS